MASASSTRRRAAPLALAICACAALVSTGADSNQGMAGPRADAWPRIAYPPARAIRGAQHLAAAHGNVSFAVIGRSIGVRGYEPDLQFSSASVSKALLLAAELRRLNRLDLPLDPGSRALLGPMITYSDNRAADAVYGRVGDEGLAEVARRAGMRDFEPTPGFWGGARITAADAARFFYRLDANLAGPHRHYAKRLLSTITPAESWGIPEAVGPGWSAWFKGGWRPPAQRHTSGPVTHQAALLEHRGGERLALAVLTEERPGGEGFAIIEGITSRLLATQPPYRGGWPVP